MPKIDVLNRTLLSWFAQNARALPWRRTNDPYAVWVSEVMLQQTQVKTVVPYWERWMKSFPTLETLARAPLNQVLKLWEGLGYYTRARNLQRAAQLIVAEQHGIFPRDFEAVLALPGVGRYTAGAICSIAFDQPTPVLDGNVVRVLTRLFAISGNVRDGKVNAKLWSLAETVVRRAAELYPRRTNRCSHLNQSLMELGATLCAARNPDCLQCPVRILCAARKQKRVHAFPNLGVRPVSTARHFVAFVVRRGNRFLIRQRPANVVNADLWEFPNIESNGASSNLARVARECLGFVPRSVEVFASLKHTITRYRISLTVVSARARRHAVTGFGEWLRMEELEALAFPSAHRKILWKLREKLRSEAAARKDT